MAFWVFDRALFLSEELADIADIIGGLLAYQSVADKVLARIRGNGRGWVFAANDFLDLGNRSSVDQSLARLAKRKEIRRLERGLYDFPKTNERLGPLSPTPQEIASAIARKTSSQIQPSGAQSANALGLTTQIPSRLVYRTVGPSRQIRTGRQILEFRHSSPKKLEGAGTPARAVIEALRHIGKRHVDEAQIGIIGRSLSSRDKKDLRRPKRNAPSWMHALIDKILSTVPSSNVYTR